MTDKISDNRPSGAGTSRHDHITGKCPVTTKITVYNQWVIHSVSNTGPLKNEIQALFLIKELNQAGD